MCLFAVAHRVSGRFPLVIAANRDEDYERPTIPADFWPDQHSIVGGRDRLHGGSWLAIDRRGRFAAVTNLRSSHGVIGKLSRGGLVREFVAGQAGAVDYLREIASRKTDYAGFHLVAGVAGREIAQLSDSVTPLGPGIYALSNADPGVRWPKVEMAEAEVARLISIDDQAVLSGRLMAFLTGGRSERRSGPGSQDENAGVTRSSIDPMGEVFVAGDRYGTRCSTVIIVDARGEVLFVEHSFGAGGAALGTPRELRFTISEPAA